MQEKVSCLREDNLDSRENLELEEFAVEVLDVNGKKETNNMVNSQYLHNSFV